MQGSLNVSAPLKYLSVVLLLLIPQLVISAECTAVARLASSEGNVEIKLTGSERWQPVTQEQGFCVGDSLRTLRESRAAVRLINDTLLRLDSGSAISFTHIARKERSILDFLKGAVHFISRTPRSLDIKTPYVNAAIEGTEFVVTVSDSATDVTVYEGLVVASNSAGSVKLAANQTGRAETGQAPVRIEVARPRDAVAWALYYPPLPQQPGAADALAQEAISALVQNRTDEASALVQQAIRANSQSAAAFMAQSYVNQARFDIPTALANSKKAVKLAPHSALALSRLAEVWLMTGDTRSARETAARAVELDPDLSLTQSTLGFASLRDINLDTATTAFEKAILLDSAAPLPRLGLGLVKIRQGELKAGREDIETAALLDPNNALLRSYMGKAYYEEKRSGLASEQFAMAKDLDPNDPTAWFYDSILLQSENRPVEALQAQQKAIELNDNRGVYRSRQLLDQDEAARNTASARIYSDLGFEKMAILDGAKALTISPDNFSAHRFMADINATQPQRNLAVESDLLQSKLLQPLTVHSLQPRLSNLQVADGPARFSYNEFNPLFTQSGPSLLIDGFIGENNTWGEDVIFSYLQDRYSISLAQYHYESDGFRETDNLEKDTLTFFSQFDATPDTMLQIEFIDDEQESGDLNQHFFNERFSKSGLKALTETETIRIGFRHHATSTSRFIGHIQQKDQTIEQSIPNLIDGLPDTPTNSDSNNLDSELQWIGTTGKAKTLIGASALNIDIDTSSTSHIPGFFYGLDDPVVQLIFDINSEQDFYNFYVYHYFPVNPELDLTLGLSYTDFEEIQFTTITDPLAGESPSLSNEKNENQFNPKIGIIWDINPKTTLRAAAYRDSRKDPLDSTLEPSQIAGFNQIFNDYASGATTESKRYGIALDHSFNENLHVGVSYLNADLNSLILSTDGTSAAFDTRRKLAEAYLYYTLSQSFSIKVDYDYEEYEEPIEAATNTRSLKTHRLPIGLSYFHSNRLSTGITSTYYNQKGLFFDFSDINQPVLAGNDDFWLTDAHLTYQLPKRLGKISLGVKNIFDKSFRYEDRINNTLFSSPTQSSNLFELSPERLLFGKFSILF